MRHARAMRAAAWFLVVALAAGVAAQEPEKQAQPAPTPSSAAARANSDPTYQQLRNLGLSGESVTVRDLQLTREGGRFRFTSGTFCFLAPVHGKVTGAVFEGEGTVAVVPPLASEERMLSLLTGQTEFVERFSRLTLRFTDATYDEIRKAGTPGGSCNSTLLSETGSFFRDTLNYNLSGRILEDVLSSRRGNFFLAHIRGQQYSDKMFFLVDAEGVPYLEHFLDERSVYSGSAAAGLPAIDVAPEEVALFTYDENKFGVWAAYHLSDEYTSGQARSTQANAPIRIEHQKIDATLDKSTLMEATVSTTISATGDGLRVIPFDLYRWLRVASVTDASGKALDFIQENMDADPQFFVLLPRELAAGERVTITTRYAGKSAFLNEGNGNFFPIARTNWFPNIGGVTRSFGNYATYEMTFRVPKGMKLVATGTLVREEETDGQTQSEWKSESPLPVAGFSFGNFRKVEDKLQAEGTQVESYANVQQPDWVKDLLHSANYDLPAQGIERSLIVQEQSALGQMDATQMIRRPLAEAMAAIQLYTQYFGPSSYKRIAMTQQTACNFGQAWPTLVFLPICGLFDTTVRQQLGLADTRYPYWNVVDPHEVAHQWWGQTVGGSSYRDQWMEEGFADFSASLFLQMVYRDPKRLQQFWHGEDLLLTEKNRWGVRAIDAGPVTLGYRLANTRLGYDVPRRLLYAKGAYILHMIRMMMWDQQGGDAGFRAMMQDFVNTYRNRPASTEDFKAMVEKHMTQRMDLDGNHRMDWFFDEYVYGTALPNYRLQYSFQDSPGGPVMSLKVTQSHVDERFRMLVPVYLELKDGKMVSLGSARIQGNNTIEQQVPLSALGIKDKPKRALLSYFNDVLCTQD